jgi:septal ring-binding cell division protein DamX
MATKTDAIVKLVLVFVISWLSFAVGTFVGKKYSDQQHKISAYEPTSQEGHHGIASKDETTAQPASQMSDEEIAKLAEEFVTDDTEQAHGKQVEAQAAATAAGHVDPKGAAEKELATALANAKPMEGHGPKSTEVVTKNGKMALAQKEATTNAATPTHEQPRQPSSTLPAIPKDVSQYPTGKYTVQVASFATETDAKKRADELKQKGYSAFYIPANVQGKTWYRVSVGQFPSEQEAKTYRAEFMAKTKIESAIIQKIVH